MKTLTQTAMLALALNFSLFALAGVAEANGPMQATDTEWAPAEDVEGEVIVEQAPGDERKRPPFYVNTMLFGGSLYEDGGNRLTSLGSRDLSGYGFILRTGAVVQDHHLIGLVFQGFLRATDSVLDATGGDGEMGMIHSYHVGPEYRYQTDWGLYVGGSMGLALTLADNDVTGVHDDTPGCNGFDYSCINDYMVRNDDSLALGLGLMGVVGYEYRPTKYFALNVEAFVTFINAIDESERTMDTVVSGVAIGIGI